MTPAISRMKCTPEMRTPPLIRVSRRAVVPLYLIMDLTNAIARAYRDTIAPLISLDSNHAHTLQVMSENESDAFTPFYLILKQEVLLNVDTITLTLQL
jgi:hypothetical protein